MDSPRHASPDTTPTIRGSAGRCAWTAATTTIRSSGTTFSGELWRRTKQAIERHLAALCRKRGIPFVRVVTASGKVRIRSPLPP
jgi:hypothetical protein